MSSIMRRRRGLISAIGKLLSEGLGFENPRSSQTGGSYCDPSLIAAPAASFNQVDPVSIDLKHSSYAPVFRQNDAVPSISVSTSEIPLARDVISRVANEARPGMISIP